MPRLVALDGLRGLAALMVFAVHAQLPGVHEALPGLDAGVLIFFALSGYLLYAPFGASMRSGRPIDIRTYAVRRLLRIAPAYLVASFAISGAWFPELLADPIGIATTSQSPILVVWTLQLEVAFYVLLPLIAYGLGRLDTVSRVRLLLIGSAISIGTTAMMMAVFHSTLGYVPGPSVSTIASYIWAFVPGMVVAELEQRGTFAKPIPVIAVAGGFGLIGASSALNAPSYFDVLASIGAALLIAFVVSRPTAGGRFDRVFLAAGALSYSVYLWYEAIINAVDRPTPTWIGGLTAAILTVAIAAVMYVGVERPALRLAHRIRRTMPRASEPRAADVPSLDHGLVPVAVQAESR
jgi:peptidoglycan/LPS O-acetylase OafA/YrhL